MELATSFLCWLSKTNLVQNAFGLLMLRTNNSDLNKALIYSILDKPIILNKTKLVEYRQLTLIYKNRRGHYKIKEFGEPKPTEFDPRYDSTDVGLVLVDFNPYKDDDFTGFGILTPHMWNTQVNTSWKWKEIAHFSLLSYNLLRARFGKPEPNSPYDQTNADQYNPGIFSRIARYGREAKRDIQNKAIAPFTKILASVSKSKPPKKQAADQPPTHPAAPKTEASNTTNAVGQSKKAHNQSKKLKKPKNPKPKADERSSMMDQPDISPSQSN